ncbi:O-antigen ligase domain-containing protein [Erythrobacter litoralis]|uniref:O-antigen ligase family protein n=1 Tax=Erythrobacter litoralis TaxID=39960 RepID=UPI0024358A82|nr:O-antigen ligase family protein [Erythrobacter litoralis]MDG6079095.1 O-antigen ligase domain-containing protein [Erythrobacter litoralis]
MKLPTAILGVLFPRNEPVLGGYSSGEVWQKRLWLYALIYLGVLVSMGALLATSGTNMLMPFSGALAIIGLLIVWALPESKNPPVKWIGRLLFAFIIALLFWPDYLAFDFPGLPWITALRIFGVPLAFVFLVSLSVSGWYRNQLSDRLAPTIIVNRLLLIFALIAGLSIGLSAEPTDSLNKFIVAILYWFIIFYAAVWIFSKPGNAMILAYVIWFFALLTCMIGIQEWRMQQIPWANHIPSFIAVDDPVIQNILSAKSRAATGIYRVQSKFTTPLGFAEFLAFSTPFVIYFLVYGKNVLVRAAALATLPLLFTSISRTDSRLGAAGFFMSILLFLVAWSVTQWKKEKGSVFGPAFTIAYPFIFIAFMIATFVVGRLRAMVWGTKAQSFSSQAREAQVEMGLPMVWSSPWGHGIGKGAETLNYRNLAGGLTIDTYYLALALEFGVIGFLVYAGIFFGALLYGVKYLFQVQTREHLLLIPFMILISVFIIVKSVFAQQENHPLVFATLGALCAMCWRIKIERGAARP